MQFASMHSHKKNTPVPRWLNCAPMHLQSQIQPLMAPTCMNASLHTQNALSQLKWSALLTHSQCTQPTQIKTYNAGMWTHAHPMLWNTSKEHQSSLCAPPNSRWPPKFFKTPPRLQKRLQEPSKTETCTSNKHKTSRSLLMHTSNQTSNHATHMNGPITCWKQ